MNRAFIFPGQGSQYIGMGKDFYETYPTAKKVFDDVDISMGFKLSDIIFNGNIEDLSITTNTQGAIMATSIAILNVLKEKTGKKIDQLCSLLAGHSLGEYSALCASGAISLLDTTTLLKSRSQAMQASSPQEKGGMAACIGVSYEELQNIILNTVKEGVCQIANDNVSGQIVISGHLYNIDLMVNILKELNYRAIKLNVSAAFHSSLMKNAEKIMINELNSTKFNQPKVPVVANVAVSCTDDVNQIKTNLVNQICGTVRWRETIDYFASNGITQLVEVGPGNVLSNLAKKSGHQFEIINIATIDDMQNFIDKNLQKAN